MVSIFLSGGACKTIMTDPIRHIAHPSFPSVPNSSFKKYDPSTAPIKTLNAPRGVTRIAGAKAYAAKFATSPTTTRHNVSREDLGYRGYQHIHDISPSHHIGLLR
jgi:hypothetical protein